MLMKCTDSIMVNCAVTTQQQRVVVDQAEMVCNDTKKPQTSITCTEVQLRYIHEHRSLCIGKFVSQMIFRRGVPVQN
jgi:hypothetical protein